MSFVAFSRNQIRKLLTKENNMILENKVPSYESLERSFKISVNLDSIFIFLSANKYSDPAYLEISF